MRTLIRAFVVSAAGLSLLVPTGATATAAEPAIHGCLGHDISGYAKAGSGFGGFVSGLASTTQGVGTEFQAHLAGDVPDTTIPNTCND
jgi:hypothetical protein